MFHVFNNIHQDILISHYVAQRQSESHRYLGNQRNIAFSPYNPEQLIHSTTCRILSQKGRQGVQIPGRTTSYAVLIALHKLSRGKPPDTLISQGIKGEDLKVPISYRTWKGNS